MTSKARPSGFFGTILRAKTAQTHDKLAHQSHHAPDMSQHNFLKAIVQKLLKKRGAISKDYTYIVFGKTKAYLQKQSVLMPLMEKSFKTIKIK